MAGQSLNEDRGARRAADLKRRFRSVSEQSIGRRSRLSSLGSGGDSTGPLAGNGRFVAIWAVIGLIAFAVGSFLT